MKKFVSPFSVRGRRIDGYINEGDLERFIDRKIHHEFVMPMVLPADAPESPFDLVRPLTGSPKIECCIKRWQDGMSWEETGIFDYSLTYIEQTGAALDGCTTLDELITRYEQLDRLYDHVAGGGRLYSSARNDAIIHIDAGGRIHFGGAAHHRTAIAWVLDVAIPVRPFLIHHQALASLSELIAENALLPKGL